MNLENRKAGELEDRPTLETDALVEQWGYSPIPKVMEAHARRFERQRDEAREIAKKYEDRYFTMSELRNNASIVALEYKAQRDRLLEALLGVLEEWEGGYRPEDCGTTMAIAREAIAEVEGSR